MMWFYLRAIAERESIETDEGSDCNYISGISSHLKDCAKDQYVCCTLYYKIKHVQNVQYLDFENLYFVK